jgi:signal peptidase II
MRGAQDVDVLSGPSPRPLRPLWWAVSTAVAVVIVDQLTKRWALAALEPGSCSQPDACIDLVAGVRFHLVFNTGAAFTRGAGYGPVLGVLALVMACTLLYLSTKRADRFGVLLFGAVAGGAVGNLLDRIFRADDGLLTGAVVDFIDLGWWPVFNVADSAIVVGVVGIIAHAFLVGEPVGDSGREVMDADDADGEIEVGEIEVGEIEVGDIGGDGDGRGGDGEHETGGPAERGDPGPADDRAGARHDAEADPASTVGDRSE